MGDNYITRFLRFLAIVDGRSNASLRGTFGIRRATRTRYLALARRLGMDIVYDRKAERYVVQYWGPFDRAQLVHAMRGHAHAKGRSS